MAKRRAKSAAARRWEEHKCRHRWGPWQLSLDPKDAENGDTVRVRVCQSCGSYEYVGWSA